VFSQKLGDRILGALDLVTYLRFAHIYRFAAPHQRGAALEVAHIGSTAAVGGDPSRPNNDSTVQGSCEKCSLLVNGTSRVTKRASHAVPAERNDGEATFVARRGEHV
jgi:hypothetical protein